MPLTSSGPRASAAGGGPDPIDPAEREAVVALHVRLVAASLDRAGARTDVDGEERDLVTEYAELEIGLHAVTT